MAKLQPTENRLYRYEPTDVPPVNTLRGNALVDLEAKANKQWPSKVMAVGKIDETPWGDCGAGEIAAQEKLRRIWLAAF
ncbi:MAG: hypothetical protein AAGJ95_06880 [Cyanobacteria bacterium J06554_11]